MNKQKLTHFLPKQDQKDLNKQNPNQNYFHILNNMQALTVNEIIYNLQLKKFHHYHDQVHEKIYELLWAPKIANIKNNKNIKDPYQKIIQHI